MKISNSAMFIQQSIMPLEYPAGPVPLNSPFYVERLPVETEIYNAIHQPGAVIRLKAPRRMGKSSMLNRVIAYAKTQQFSTVVVDINQADEDICANLDQFLRWFCVNISEQLQLPPLLDSYWDEEISSKINCTLYWQGYVLEQISSPILLVFNEINRLFEYPVVGREFLYLLRSWHEETKQLLIWEKLRLFLIYSTEVYIPLNINQSPFNIGISINLPPLTLEEIQDLAERHNLPWQNTQNAEKLMNLVGGHPYLVRLALYHWVQTPEISLEQLLTQASTSTGIYAEHLLEIWDIIKHKPQLLNVLKALIKTPINVRLNTMGAYELEGMGLIKISGYKAQLSCQLYRLFFEEILLRSSELTVDCYGEFNKIRNIDELTEVYNRRYFTYYLESEWNNFITSGSPIALILCDLDRFQIYNDHQGHLVGDQCLKQIAKAIQNCIQTPLGKVVRYAGDEFAVILPHTSATDAMQIAESIREAIQQLNMMYPPSKLSSEQLTVSCGGCSLIPSNNGDLQTLISNADQALYQSKTGGRNQVTWIDLTQPSSVQKLGRVR